MAEPRRATNQARALDAGSSCQLIVNYSFKGGRKSAMLSILARLHQLVLVFDIYITWCVVGHDILEFRLVFTINKLCTVTLS